MVPLRTRIFAAFLSLLMVFSIFPTEALCAETDLSLCHDSYADTRDGTVADELFTQYAMQTLYGSGISLYGTAAGDTLKGNERVLYDALVPLIRQIAAGERSSTVLAVGKPVTDQHGVHYPVDREITFPDTVFYEDSLDRVMAALLTDFPYEMYWYDKVSGCSMFYFRNSRSILQFNLSFYVTDAYQGSDTFSVDTKKTGGPAAAAAYAKSIAAAFAAATDYEKLTGYKDAICDLADYEYGVPGSQFSSDNDPWQLIYVFDQDPSTNVVCEGYAKAFQYLCDLGTFQADVSCITVSGHMDGNSHMWNIVSIGGKHYLADVTNSDYGAVGDDGSLFLAGGSGSIADGYRLPIACYSYDNVTRMLWGTGNDSILNLSEARYDPASDIPKASVARIYGADRYDTAFQSADALLKTLGTGKFSNIIVACGTNFPDALAGTYLAAKKDAPILLVKGSNVSKVNAYIQANLTPGGTLYLLGDSGVVPDSVGQGISGITVKRLGGTSRYDTNLLILKEAGVAEEDIIVCTGQNFADSLSASAVGLPILLVKNGLTSAQKEFLAATSGDKIIIGGTGAVNQNIENALKAYGSVRRIGGSTRYETSVLVAQEFFSAPSAAILAYAKDFPDGLCGGPLAYSLGAPLILTVTGKESTAVSYATANGIRAGYVLGGAGLISDASANRVFGRDSKEPIPLP